MTVGTAPAGSIGEQNEKSARSPMRAAGRGLVRATGPGAAIIYLSLLVLIPIAAVATKAFDGGWGAFWSAIRNPEGFAALKFTLLSGLIVVVVNTLAGTAIAWVLVRDEFHGKRALGYLVDLPFALPTVIAGLTLLSLYGHNSPIHVSIANTRLAVWVALAFVTLPFAVRSIQPVLEELDLDSEEAAASLGASSFTVFRRIILPSLAPAMISGAALSFARALGEYGSLVLFTSGIPFHTMVGSIYIFGLFESGEFQQAAAVSLALLVMSLVVLLVLGAARRHFAREEVSG